MCAAALLIDSPFYLYTGPTIQRLRFVFGWSEAIIHAWINTIIPVIVDELFFVFGARHWILKEVGCDY